MKRQLVAAFGCGVLFAVGLALSGMTEPARVLGFLDFFGAWDPTLAFVMMGAIGTHAVLYRMVTRRMKPVLAAEFSIPKKRDLDQPLILGSALFGVGWGLSGLCPGPAIENLATLSPRLVVFVIAMALGMAAHDAWQPRRVVTAPSALATKADG